MEPYVNLDAAAAFLGVRPSWLYANHRALGVPSVRIGRMLRFRLSELTAWAEARRDGR